MFDNNTNSLKRINNIGRRNYTTQGYVQYSRYPYLIRTKNKTNVDNTKVKYQSLTNIRNKQLIQKLN